LIVNVVGSFVIGAFAALSASEGPFLIRPEIRIFVMVGLCGGYTTFSSFSLQTFALWREGEWLWAGANSALSFILCLLAVWLGHVAVASLIR
jgi:CrcB protein